MTPEQFNAAIAWPRRFSPTSRAVLAARSVLVDGVKPDVAAKSHGISHQSVYMTIKRIYSGYLALVNAPHDYVCVTVVVHPSNVDIVKSYEVYRP